MQLTIDLLEKILPFASDRKRIDFLTPLNETFKEFHINNPRRLAAFMAQIEHESGSLNYVRELASGEAYSNRKDLGNTCKEALEIVEKQEESISVGAFYKGRGLLQITGFANYKACGEGLNLDLIHNPSLLEEPLHAARSAGWFWSTHNLNSYADVELFGKITHIINGGYNGAEERLKNYHKNLRVLKVTGK